jgi:oxygen-independent coproporphyrinogen-3 oxidase
LTIEPGTVFSKQKEKGEMLLLGEEEERRFFIETAQVLETAGYIHYEISNFARARHLRSRHNWKYWDHTPYLGIGPSAHSFSGQKRWWNIKSIRKYCSALEAGEFPVEGSEDLTPEQMRLETLALGLRTKDGVEMDAISCIPGSSAVLERLIGDGLVRLEGGLVVPTRNGFLFADALPGCFF